MAEFINITKIERVTQTSYRVYFEENFNISNLSYEFSLDGINWNNPMLFSTTTSPQILSNVLTDNFYVRLKTDYNPTPPTPPTPYTRIHSLVFTQTYN